MDTVKVYGEHQTQRSDCHDMIYWTCNTIWHFGTRCPVVKQSDELMMILRIKGGFLFQESLVCLCEFFFMC